MNSVHMLKEPEQGQGSKTTNVIKFPTAQIIVEEKTLESQKKERQIMILGTKDSIMYMILATLDRIVILDDVKASWEARICDSSEIPETVYQQRTNKNHFLDRMFEPNPFNLTPGYGATKPFTRDQLFDLLKKMRNLHKRICDKCRRQYLFRNSKPVSNRRYCGLWCKLTHRKSSKIKCYHRASGVYDYE